MAAAASAVIYCIYATCTARISASILVVVLVAAEAASRMLTIVPLSLPPDVSDAFSASRALAYSEMTSYYAWVTVTGLWIHSWRPVTRISAADS